MIRRVSSIVVLLRGDWRLAPCASHVATNKLAGIPWHPSHSKPLGLSPNPPPYVVLVAPTATPIGSRWPSRRCKPCFPAAMDLRCPNR